ncbi:uncharacterized protein PV07_12640 [Cladophialophora immunda]|uniref:Uncharacterized protein n=1 Tax=Cladophialophora immunda TaxID=569365 RepID=A0A0D1Z2W9_9EURO|nr:uncharacterized protein PV07_12640 [Cladophialophora immunda]KIW21956.1 hypothetical protein PV07_12640 [Cladophialophora immunda]
MWDIDTKLLDLGLESDGGAEPDLSELLSLTSEDAFGNEDVEGAVDAYSWKADYSTGYHRLRGASM